MILTPKLLIQAYCHGYFPMPDPQTNEIVWLNPDPRAVIPLANFHISHSLAKKIKKNYFSFTINQCFEEVINACANRTDTWITSEIQKAYIELYKHGNAHSIEAWYHDKLVGGLYGVQIGGAFFAESKFHTHTDASKAALFFLVGKMQSLKMTLLEVQFLTPHLERLGAVEVSNSEYSSLLLEALTLKVQFK